MSAGEPPLVPGPIHGVRVWSIHRDGGRVRLAGMFQGGEWPPGGEPLEAACVASGDLGARHRPPQRHCGCGVYALHPRDDAAPQLESAELDRFEAPCFVAGILEAWGTVELHEDGFRAQYARPKALALLGPNGGRGERVVRGLAERYDAELLRLPDADALIEHCRANGLGLDEAVVRDLVPDFAPDPDDDEDVAAWLSAPAPTFPSPGPGPPAPRSRWERVREVLFSAFLILLGVLWYGMWAAFAVLVAIGLITGGWGEDPSPPTSRDLEVVEERLIRAGNELHYIALVENTSADEAALGVHPRGSFLDARAETVAEISRRSRIDMRSSLAPGETGVVVDRRRARGADPADVELWATWAEARRTPMPEAASPQPSFSRVDLDRSSCRIAATVRAPAAVPNARVAVLARDRSGAISAAGRIATGPLPAGRSRRVLNRGVEGDCPGFIHEVELFPHSTRARFVDETSG